jgi:hypothetical protein
MEEAEHHVLEALLFEFEHELPYEHIVDFCHQYVPVAYREGILDHAMKFCNDSFKLPLCLLYHPKIIAAACIYMAALWRKTKSLDIGIPLTIKGHNWFKWIDSSIELEAIKEVIEHMKLCYSEPKKCT